MVAKVTDSALGIEKKYFILFFFLDLCFSMSGPCVSLSITREPIRNADLVPAY